MKQASRDRLLKYERLTEPVAPRSVYYARLRRSIATGGVLVLVSLGIGALGYHGFESLPWIDAFLNASMILGGMGPVDSLHTTGGKLFATAYALYSGLVLLLTAGIVIAPAVHRLLHRFHVDQ
ncbi:MAG TPA: hypothetical protein VE046_00155 [Steroidobacteraceae bacterium]|nr:hypothetical protein [Steroidobacteraceae bacterium]